MNLSDAIKDAAEGGKLNLDAAGKIAREFDLSLMDVEKAALTTGVWPLRFTRHEGLITPEQQIRLMSSRVVVAGCGGIGGYVSSFLARLGIGHLVLVDPDRFRESNLNRQLFCSVTNLGRYKAEVAAEVLSTINPASRLEPVVKRLEDSLNSFRASDLCLDCLDSRESRRVLSATCQDIKIPLVYAAVSGTCVQVAVEMPGKRIFERLYPPGSRPHVDDGLAGIFSFTTGAAAAFQAAQALKLLLPRVPDSDFRGIFLDIRGPELEIMEFF